MLLAGCGRLHFDGSSRTADAARPADAALPDGFFGVGSWTATPPGPLSARVWTGAVWTGSRFLVFGGATDPQYDATDTGALFDPATQTWTPMSTTGDPGPRHTVRMVMIGGQMIEYAGGSGLGAIAGGGRYDPQTDTWSPMSTTNAPGARLYACALAIGDRMLTWGGWKDPSHLQTGGIYDPQTDTWTAMSTVGAPSARSFASAVWTGSDVIVWGGCSGGLPQCATAYGDGAIYNPATDTWRPMSSTGAPSPRYEHTAVWTGSEMIVFGGAADASEATALGDGGIYDPATDTWRALATTGAPTPRIDASAAMLGGQMLIWGSDKGDSYGFLYDPATDHWTEIAWPNAPALRSRWAWAVSDRQLFVWGGAGTTGYLATGSVWTAP